MNGLIRSARSSARAIACTALSAFLAASAATALAAPSQQAQLSTRSTAQVQVGLTLEQAVAQVQRKTAGKVLQASTRQRGQITEYRIKVLTPDGHVRVVSVRSRPAPGQQSKDAKHKENG